MVYFVCLLMVDLHNSNACFVFLCSQEVLVHPGSCEDTRKCNGSSQSGGGTLKKNLGGKWKKLVKKKNPQEAYTIPAELKDQLKQIYVY